MYYSYVMEKCSNCKKALYLKLLNIYGFLRVYSGLGPNYLICSSCKSRRAARTKEWVQMSLPWKIWYLFLSIIDGGVLGLLTSAFIGEGIEKLFKKRVSMEMIVFLFTIVIIGIQLLRIILSVERTGKQKETEMEVSFWNWQTNLQLFGMIWIFIIVLGGAAFQFIK